LPIIKKETLFNKIDFEFIYSLNGILPELNNTYFSALENCEEIVK